MDLTTESGGGLVSRPRSSLEEYMRIRIRKAGVGKVIQQRSDWPEGALLTVPKYDGDMFVREGWGELVVGEPAAEEATQEEEEIEAEPETATAEPAGETAIQTRPPRRRRGV